MNKIKYWLKYQFWKRFPKNTSGFEHRNYLAKLSILKRPLCWVIGHDEAGVYSWISYCQRCFIGFDSIPPKNQKDLEGEEEYYESYFDKNGKDEEE